MPSALSVPICELTSYNGACVTRTRNERKAKPIIIAMTSVIAIFTIVHRRSSRCSRNGLVVSLSGNSRNLKMSRSAIGSKTLFANYFGVTRLEGEKTVRGQTDAKAQRVGVANFV